MRRVKWQAVVVSSGQTVSAPYYTGRAAQQAATKAAKVRGEDVKVTRDDRDYGFVAHADGSVTT